MQSIYKEKNKLFLMHEEELQKNEIRLGKAKNEIINGMCNIKNLTVSYLV